MRELATSPRWENLNYKLSPKLNATRPILQLLHRGMPNTSAATERPGEDEKEEAEQEEEEEEEEEEAEDVRKNALLQAIRVPRISPPAHPPWQLD